MYLTANLIGMNCVTGMSILIKKYLLDDLGGIENFGKYLAEDYFIAQAIQNKGYSTVICSQPGSDGFGYPNSQKPGGKPDFFGNQTTRPKPDFCYPTSSQ